MAKIVVIKNSAKICHNNTDHYQQHTLTKISLSVLKTLDCRDHPEFSQMCSFRTHTNIYTSITQYLTVADNARDAVFLHVSASSERQECGIKIGLIKKKTKQVALKLSHT
jgi:hypothetical protein